MSRRTNEQWLADLRSPGPEQDAALSDLRLIILAGLPYALSPYLGQNDPRFEALTEETAQDTLLRVLARLDEFEGRSQFTTWVYTIAVRLALSELRRKRWENISLEALLEDEENPPPPGLAAAPDPSPERQVEGNDLASRLRRIIDEELTEKQRQALMALAIHGMPMEEAARRLGTNRNALYKMLHDARLRIKRRLADEGLSPDDVGAAMGSSDRLLV
jgi:RNA polymerase sigma-70 factor (ECF subfamily)